MTNIVPTHNVRIRAQFLQTSYEARIERPVTAFIVRLTDVSLATDVSWIYEQNYNCTFEQPLISWVVRTFDLQVVRPVRGGLSLSLPPHLRSPRMKKIAPIWETKKKKNLTSKKLHGRL